MPYATSDGVQIYYEVAGSGPPVMFAHGGTSSLESWKDGGFIDRLSESYMAILYDARGHGQSDRLYAHEDYTLRLMAQDALAVLDVVGVAQTHFVGYSMGGWTAFQLVQDAPQRLRSLILGGTSPARDPHPIDAPPSPLLQAMRDGITQGADAVVAAVRAIFGDISPEYEGRLRRLDYRAMVVMLEHFRYHSINQSAILPTISVPCMVYMSEADDPGFVTTQTWMRSIPDASFTPIGGTHASSDSDAEEAVIRQFLAHVEAGR